MSRSPRPGFTLIELLVVIAIIAILAAILFPVFARARAKAKQANCLSNVKQLSLSLQMYLDDFDSTYPMYMGAGTWPPNIGSRLIWFDLIMPYVKNRQIFKCPGGTDGCSAVQGWAANEYSYGAVADMGGLAAFGKYTRTVGADENKVIYPANCIVLADHWWPGVDMDDWNGTENGGSFSSYNWRHNEGFNVGYADGHAKFLAKGKAAANKSQFTVTADPD